MTILRSFLAFWTISQEKDITMCIKAAIDQSLRRHLLEDNGGFSNVNPLLVI